MLRLNRKQMAGIGQDHMRQALRDFLARYFPGAAQVPEAEMDAAIDDVIEHCRAHGLRTQSAVATYALASYVFGREVVDSDPAVREILQARERPSQDRALLLQVWLIRAWGNLQRSQGR